MKKENNTLLKLYAILTSLIIVTVLMISTYSWYNNNRKTENYQLPVTTDVAAEVSCGDYLVYKKRIHDAAGNPLAQPEYEIFNSLDNISLNYYDSVFGRNEDTAIIVRIPVSVPSAEDGKIKIIIDRANVPGPVTTDEYGLIANSGQDAGLIVNYLSNISDYKFGVISSLNSTSDDNAEKIYEDAHTAFNSINSSDAFASQTRIDTIYHVTKDTNEIKYILSYKAADIISDPTTEARTLYLYVEIDYDPYLTAAYLQNHKNNFKVGKLGDVELLKFIGDLNAVTMSASD